ncbi:hypothetical protein EMCRGX_G026677 [Ephydatia muelleri]
MRTSWLSAVCFQIFFELIACAPALQQKSSVEVDKRATFNPLQMDFLELKRTCLERGWFDCYNGLQEIWVKTDTSNPNSTLSLCLVSARWYQNTSAASTSTVGAESCPLLDSAKKTDARRKYCEIYSQIKITWQLYLSRTLTEKYASVSHDASIGAPTPGQLKDALLLWISDTTNRHLGDSPCCNNSGLLILRKRLVWNWCSDKPTSRARDQCLWEKALVDAGATIRTSELLESLGRLQKCLRGCASLEEVQCSNMLPTPGRR